MKWQYIGFYEEHSKSHEVLNSMGQSGWELVSVNYVEEGAYCYHMKRPLPNDKEETKGKCL